MLPRAVAGNGSCTASALTRQGSRAWRLCHLANDYTNLVPKLLASMLPQLQANAIMPRLVNRDYDGLAAQLGSVISVPLPPTIAVVDVTPANTPPSTTDITPGVANVTLDKWKEAPFHVSDKEMREIQAGSVPSCASSAMRALIDSIDQSILTAMSIGASGVLGTAGTNPFATIALAIEPITRLNDNLLPQEGRHVVFNASAQANLLALQQFTDMQYTGDVGAMTNGNFLGNSRLGAQWWMDQNIRQFTNSGTQNGAYLLNGAATIGATTLAIDTGSGTFVAGDVIVIDGHRYVVAANAASGATSLTIRAPGMRTAAADNSTITGLATHKANFAFSRDSVVFASRPFAPSASGVIASQSMTDPVSGITVRLEVTREHKRDRWSLDALWGTDVVRPNGVIKIAG